MGWLLDSNHHTVSNYPVISTAKEPHHVTQGGHHFCRPTSNIRPRTQAYWKLFT